MNEDTPVFLGHCDHWLKLSLTPDQSKQVLKIKAIAQERHAINEEILSFVEKFKHHTINQIMEMDPAALALDVLMGKIDPASSKEETL